MNTATDSELTTFWGTEVTKRQWDEATRRHGEAYDKDDLTAVCWENESALCDALSKGDFMRVGVIFQNERAKTITRRVEIEFYGRTLDNKTEKPT